jgi:hypothetical protein
LASKLGEATVVTGGVDSGRVAKECGRLQPLRASNYCAVWNGSEGDTVPAFGTNANWLNVRFSP